MREEQRKIKGCQGITLIALVVTIVVLLILAGVSISMLTGENGIIKQAQESKEANHIAQEKEMLQLAVVAANNYETGKIDEEKLRKELTNYTGGADKYTLTKSGNLYTVKFNDSGRSYPIKDGENKEVVATSYSIRVKFPLYTWDFENEGFIEAGRNCTANEFEKFGIYLEDEKGNILNPVTSGDTLIFENIEFGKNYYICNNPPEEWFAPYLIRDLLDKDCVEYNTLVVTNENDNYNASVTLHTYDYIEDKWYTYAWEDNSFSYDEASNYLNITLECFDGPYGG